ncbi:hypothetical protein ACM66B_005389 [Microbotryomycetes sp. NB124-2]
MPKLKDSPLCHISSIYDKALEDDRLDQLSLNQIRTELERDFGWTCEKQEWKQHWKPLIEQEWHKLADEQAASSSARASSAPQPVKPKLKKDGSARKTKYERVAEKNTIMGAFLQDLTASTQDDDDDDESLVVDDDEDQDSLSQAGGTGSSDNSRSSSVSAQPVKSKSNKGKAREEQEPPTKKKKRAATKVNSAQIKSAETISDSDNEGPSTSKAIAAAAGGGGSKTKTKKRRSSKDVIERDDEAVTKKQKQSAAAKGKAKERAPPKPKEGDAPRGTEEQEERVKKLKSLVAATGVERAFTAATGAERKLTIDERFDRLETLLVEAKVFKRGGKLPSVEACRKVGVQRALEKEMAELKGTPETTGLRDGKRRTSDGKQYEDKPKFGAFLDAFDDSDSDSD